MKWNNRLKSVLTKTEESGFSGECLKTQLTITDKTHSNLVSSAFVSDEFRHSPENLTNSEKNENHSNLVSSAFVSGYPRHSFKNNNELADIKSEKLHEILNRFIESGVTFDVSTDDFQIVDNAKILKTSDKQFLELNYSIILCQLQQSLLMKHLFSHSPERFEDFAFEITEREAMLTKTDEKDFEIYFQIVKSVTRKWFADLLGEELDPVSAFIN